METYAKFLKYVHQPMKHVRLDLAKENITVAMDIAEVTKT
jgi:hypothetical protein